MKILPLTLQDARKYLESQSRHYVTEAEPICAIGVGEVDQIDVTTIRSSAKDLTKEYTLHGAAILGRRADGDAELTHIYADGTSQAYSLLYGACWRALKALGYERAYL